MNYTKCESAEQAINRVLKSVDRDSDFKIIVMDEKNIAQTGEIYITREDLLEIKKAVQ